MRNTFGIVSLIAVCSLMAGCAEQLIDADAARLEISGGEFFVATPSQRFIGTLCSVADGGFKTNCRSEMNQDRYGFYPDDPEPPGKQKVLIRTPALSYEISRYTLPGPARVVLGQARAVTGYQLSTGVASPIPEKVSFADTTLYFEPEPDTVFVLGQSRVSGDEVDFTQASAAEVDALRTALVNAQGDKASKLNVVPANVVQINCTTGERNQTCKITGSP